MSVVPVPHTFRTKNKKLPQGGPPNLIATPSQTITPTYSFEDGLRRVAPYHFTYNTYCKQRWRGREVLEVFASEFRDRTIDYYKEAIESGAVAINGKPIPSIHTIMKNGDVISHTLHRHEPPVTAQPIGIVHEDEGMLIINKPAGVPVHPAGRYNYNSIVEILRYERSKGWNPLPCHRLDRLTSGIMFIGKHPAAADALSKQIVGRNVEKEYVARVKGKFPEGEVICEQPILQISPKLGLNRVRASGKAAKTVFTRIAYYGPKEAQAAGASIGEGNGLKGPPSEEQVGMSWKTKEGYSIVRCLPFTGRTHQLRVHLQFLGHPISNDPIYCNQRVFGANLGKGDAQSDMDEDILSRLARMGKDEVAEAVAYHDEMVDQYQRKRAEKLSGTVCKICETPLYTDPGVHELGIYLHAKRYSCKDEGWSYETPLPSWALPPQPLKDESNDAKETEHGKDLLDTGAVPRSSVLPMPLQEHVVDAGSVT